MKMPQNRKKYTSSSARPTQGHQLETCAWFRRHGATQPSKKCPISLILVPVLTVTPPGSQKQLVIRGRRSKQRAENRKNTGAFPRGAGLGHEKSSQLVNTTNIPPGALGVQKRFYLGLNAPRSKLETALAMESVHKILHCRIGSTKLEICQSFQLGEGENSLPE